MSQPEHHPESVPAQTLTVPVQKVFLSSTSADLHKWRSRIDELLPYLGQFSVVMGRFAERPLGTVGAASVSLDELRDCQIYILLLGWRYGHIPPVEIPLPLRLPLLADGLTPGIARSTVSRSCCGGRWLALLLVHRYLLPLALHWLLVYVMEASTE
jgi:Domain of unknown function (DUF4062)